MKIRMPKNIWVKRFLWLLALGVSLGLSPTPRHYFRLLKSVPKEWRKLEREHIYRLSSSLKKRGFIEHKQVSKNEVRIFITPRGREYLKKLDFSELELPVQGRWDGKWRLILFDIPEIKRRSRDALRRKLKELGCYELQKSVFLWPYDCKKEIEFVIHFFNLKSFVIYAEASLDNDYKIKRAFHIV